jgi:sec-independent protein translocase protein TatA
MFRNFGAPEILILLFIILLLFGAKRLPDMARGMGRSLRIFKAETKGLSDDADEARPADQAKSESPAPTADAASERRSDSDSER